MPAPMYGGFVPQPMPGAQGYPVAYDMYGQPIQAQAGFQRGGYQGRGGYSRGGGSHFHQNQGGAPGHFGGQQNFTKTVDIKKYKTTLCRHFETNGSCTLGDNCQFAHGPQDMRNPSDV